MHLKRHHVDSSHHTGTVWIAKLIVRTLRRCQGSPLRVLCNLLEADPRGLAGETLG